MDRLFDRVRTPSLPPRIFEPARCGCAHRRQAGLIRRDWLFSVACGLLILEAIATCGGYIIFGNRLGRVKNHPEHAKSLNTAADDTHPGQSQNAPGYDSIFLIQTFNRPSHLNMIDGKGAHDLDEGEWSVCYCSLSNRSDVSPQVFFIFIPNRAFLESPIQVIMPLSAVVVHKPD